MNVYFKGPNAEEYGRRFASEFHELTVRWGGPAFLKPEEWADVVIDTGRATLKEAADLIAEKL